MVQILGFSIKTLICRRLRPNSTITQTTLETVFFAVKKYAKSTQAQSVDHMSKQSLSSGFPTTRSFKRWQSSQHRRSLKHFCQATLLEPGRCKRLTDPLISSHPERPKPKNPNPSLAQPPNFPSNKHFTCNKLTFLSHCPVENFPTLPSDPVTDYFPPAAPHNKLNNHR